MPWSYLIGRARGPARRAWTQTRETQTCTTSLQQVVAPSSSIEVLGGVNKGDVACRDHALTRTCRARQHGQKVGGHLAQGGGGRLQEMVAERFQSVDRLPRGGGYAYSNQSHRRTRQASAIHPRTSRLWGKR